MRVKQMTKWQICNQNEVLHWASINTMCAGYSLTKAKLLHCTLPHKQLPAIGQQYQVMDGFWLNLRHTVHDVPSLTDYAHKQIQI